MAQKDESTVTFAARDKSVTLTEKQLSQAMKNAGKLRIVRDAEFESENQKMFPIPTDIAFEAEEDADYLTAEELEEVACKVIKEKLPHLVAVSFRYLWKRAGGSKGAKPIIGQTKRVTGLLKHFCDSAFVIWLAADHCRALAMTPFKIEAALYHELLHVQLDPETSEPFLIGHDFEGFINELAHYGTWRDDLRRVGEQIKLL